MKPWLSVIMPVHNGAHFIAEALASVAAEKPEGVEVRIYNSGDDRGAARRIAEKFAGQIDLYWHDRTDLTPWTSKTNLGVAEARAAHIVMLHQDDLWLPGHLAAVRKAIAEHPDAAMSVGPSQFAAPDGRLLNVWKLPFPAGSLPGTDVLGPLLVQNTIAVPSVVIRRSAWQDCGGMDETLWYTADWDLYLKLASGGPVHVRSTPTTAFRVHGGSLTMTGRRDMRDFQRQLETVLERHLTAIGVSPHEVADRAKASILINCALAAFSSGQRAGIVHAISALVSLGPSGIGRYIAESRIIDRLLPRLRLKMACGL